MCLKLKKNNKVSISFVFRDCEGGVTTISMKYILTKTPNPGVKIFRGGSWMQGQAGQKGGRKVW